MGFTGFQTTTQPVGWHSCLLFCTINLDRNASKSNHRCYVNRHRHVYPNKHSVPDILCMSSIHGMQRNLDQIGSFMFILLLYMFEYDLHSILNVSMRWLWTFFECTFLSTRPPQHPLRAWRSAFVLRQIRMESSQESFGSHSALVMPRPRHHSWGQSCREEEQVGQRAQSWGE